VAEREVGARDPRPDAAQQRGEAVAVPAGERGGALPDGRVDEQVAVDLDRQPRRLRGRDDERRQAQRQDERLQLQDVTGTFCAERTAPMAR
jgi:hypothetical protein